MEIVVPREDGGAAVRGDQVVRPPVGGGRRGAGEGLQRTRHALRFAARSHVGLQARQVVRQRQRPQGKAACIEGFFKVERLADGGRRGVVIEGPGLLPVRGIEDDVLVPRPGVPPVPEPPRVAQPVRFDTGVLHEAGDVAFEQRRGGGVVGRRQRSRFGLDAVGPLGRRAAGNRKDEESCKGGNSEGRSCVHRASLLWLTRR